MTDVEESHSTVGFHYTATLEWGERVPRKDGSNGLQTHWMEVKGRVHPQPYNLDAACELVDRKLRPLVDLGWDKVQVTVKAYGQ